MDPSIGPGRPDLQIRPLRYNPVIDLGDGLHVYPLVPVSSVCACFARCNGAAFYDRPGERALTCEEIRFTTWSVEHDCEAALSELVLITGSRHTHASIGTCCSYAPAHDEECLIPGSFFVRASTFSGLE
ncbi:hypothetical protein PENNAL_c0415G04183 [Penicillium nalgiovense]|uniref:Uncharacterized protein n=1 Tax=Penicillium nalgiovense TaxID=60175 RepID=A0A1V6W103_PENNA|nr:hypothetical protein PENNAL_c0415G04183 [Penicillium nalgiovense]